MTIPSESKYDQKAMLGSPELYYSILSPLMKGNM